MQQKIELFKKELSAELNSILHYWMEYAIDETHGGFYGKIDNDNAAAAYACKGAVLNARILWTFSAAYNQLKEKKYLNIAGRAFHYILDHFKDNNNGGVYWSVDEKGNVLEDRKQIYALAFTVYGMSEYYAATQHKAALDFALELYYLIEQHSYDPVNKGYSEAFSKEWGSLNDLRLSDKDANEKKTMNTHLHIIEAYTNLFKSWPDPLLKTKIEELLLLYDTYFINHATNHLCLFFDEQWNEKPVVISYGHDIEAAWLLQQCAEISDAEKWINPFQASAIAMTDAAIHGLADDGGMWYEYVIDKKHLIKEKHWWVQAEAMIGFFNAWQLTNDEKYLNLSLNSWRFIQQHLLDKEKGEWFWGIEEDDQPMKGTDKVGLWKCPYHNSRACIEIIRRIEKQEEVKYR